MRLFDIDLESASLEVLKTIYHASRLELERRRNVGAVGASEYVELVSKSRQAVKGRTWGRKKFHPKAYKKHLKPIIDSDWSALFSGDLCRKYYVYLHVKPSRVPIDFNEAEHGIDLKVSGVPFYVGKGSGGRAFDLKRNEGHGRVLRSLKENGVDAEKIVCIVKDGMTEPEALELESKLIYFFGTQFEAGRKGILVNLEIPARPDGFY